MITEVWRDNPGNPILWGYDEDVFGGDCFSFDGGNIAVEDKRWFVLFDDYPYGLTAEQRGVFEKEYPNWANFFSFRFDPAYTNALYGKTPEEMLYSKGA